MTDTCAATRRSAQRRGDTIRLLTDFLPAAGEHAQGGDLADGLCFVEEQRQRGLERGERHLVRAHDAGHRILSDGLHPVGSPEDDASLRAANELVGAATDQIGAGPHRVAERGFMLESEL